jgi:flagellar assembly protein FliH
MSDQGPSDHARNLSLIGLAAGRNSAFSRDRRFLAPEERHLPDSQAAPAPEEDDPVADAYARGYADGAEAGDAAARTEAAATDAARHRIESALTQMDAAEVEAFAGRLQETVLALCATVLGAAAVVPEALEKRIAVAAAMFARSGDERVIRLHPEDLLLVEGRLPDAWHCDPDATLERGTLRIETADGGVEDGPTQWRAALDEALRAW